MKFGETFTEFLHEHEDLQDNFAHVGYKRLKKVLKRCRACRALHGSSDGDAEEECKEKDEGQLCQLENCASKYSCVW